MAGLGDYALAAQMRDQVNRMVESTMERVRPGYRYATVVSINRTSRKCEVQYPGEAVTVMVNMGHLQPFEPGQVVRIDGRMGDRFIDDVMGPVWVDESELVMTEAEALAYPDKYEGQRFFLTDRWSWAYYSGGAFYDKPWNTAWGVIAMQVLLASSSVYSVSGNSDMVMNVAVWNSRNYRVHLVTNTIQSAAGLWTIMCTENGSTFGRFFTSDGAKILGYHYSSSLLFLPTTTQVATLRVTHTEVVGSATWQYEASATAPRQFWIEDIGPRTRLDDW